MVCTPDQISGDAGAGGGRGFGGGAGGAGGRNRSAQDLDEKTLVEVADLTGGEYFKAVDAEALAKVLTNLPNDIVLQRRNTEITVWFALVGALLAMVAVGLAQWWNPT